MPVRQCNRCGSEYKYKKCREGKTKYCSRNCKRPLHMRKKLICKFCKSEFVYDGPKGPGYEAKTCSKSCRHNLTGLWNKKNRKHELLTLNCKICDKAYQTTRADSSTCSKKCHGAYLSKKYKGRKLTKQWIENQNKSKTKEKIVKYGEFECDRCGKIFKKNTSLRAHKARCGHDVTSKCDICGRIFKSKSALSIHRNHHDKEFSEKYSKAMKKMAKKRTSPCSTSKAETSFYERLSEILDIKVQHKFKIPGYSHEYDIFIPELKLIVEFDGDYWHGNKSTQDTLTPRMKQQYHIDRGHSEKAVSSGYNILRVWSSESNEVLRRLKCSSSKSSLLLEMSSQNRFTTSK